MQVSVNSVHWHWPAKPVAQPDLYALHWCCRRMSEEYIFWICTMRFAYDPHATRTEHTRHTRSRIPKLVPCHVLRNAHARMARSRSGNGAPNDVLLMVKLKVQRGTRVRFIWIVTPANLLASFPRFWARQASANGRARQFLSSYILKKPILKCITMYMKLLLYEEMTSLMLIFFSVCASVFFFLLLLFSCFVCAFFVRFQFRRCWCVTASTRTSSIFGQVFDVRRSRNARKRPYIIHIYQQQQKNARQTFK